jgi:UDP-N-acetylglucosamine/UDP-N-acetylgalactosamine diphosphorylase
MATSYEQAKELLAKHGQSHVLKFWDKIMGGQQAKLLHQISALDFDSIDRMRKILADSGKAEAAKSSIEPAPVVRLTGAERAKAARAGMTALRKGEVGALLVAGGQGSRLGFDGPKGCFEIGPVSKAPLFAFHCGKILASERKYQTKIPFYIMTSDANDKETKLFFEKHNYFGLSKDRVKFFVQGMWPALWPDGRILMDAPDHIFTGPDGHGGILAALRANGMLDDMTNRGLKTLSYFQVDNPLVEITDPAFIGLHCERNAEMSVKVCAKRDAEEGLGIMVLRGGRNSVVEYTELTKEQKYEKLPNGHFKFLYGSVAIHVFSLAFLKKEASAQLPLHIAHKKVPYCDDNGRTVKPDAPNAFKFEKFIFDVLPDAGVSVNLEFAREDEFSPVKNAAGNDSPATTQRDMMRKFARWLKQCNIQVPVNADGDLKYKTEIDPCFALDVEELGRKLPENFKITHDTLLK